MLASFSNRRLKLLAHLRVQCIQRVRTVQRDQRHRAAHFKLNSFVTHSRDLNALTSNKARIETAFRCLDFFVVSERCCRTLKLDLNFRLNKSATLRFSAERRDLRRNIHRTERACRWKA